MSVEEMAHLYQKRGIAHGGDLTWADIGAPFGISGNAARKRVKRYLGRGKGQPPGPQPLGLKLEKDQNIFTLTCTTDRIVTLEQLLEFAEVDLDVWQVDWYIVNKWEVGAKSEWKDLTFTSGRIDGSLISKGLQVEPLFQVKAKLVRKQPIPVFPHIQPVECSVTYDAPPRPRTEGMGCSVILSDPQFGFSREVTNAKLEPFHDRRVLDLVLQLVSALQPDRIDILGDFFDFVMWTDRFLRSPRFEYTTQPAICEGHRWLRLLREACPNAKIKLHEGNHDMRMRLQVMKHLRAAYGLRAADEMDLPPMLTPQRLLALHKLGIEWHGDYPNDEDWLNDNLTVCHGDTYRGGPGDSAKTIVMKTDTNVITGHAHRQELASRTLFLREGVKTIEVHCVGCACRIDGVVPGKKSKQEWQQGCGVAFYEIDGDLYSFTPIPIRDGKMVWNGQVFTARDCLADLRRDLPDWNW